MYICMKIIAAILPKALEATLCDPVFKDDVFDLNEYSTIENAATADRVQALYIGP